MLADQGGADGFDTDQACNVRPTLQPRFKSPLIPYEEVPRKPRRPRLPPSVLVIAESYLIVIRDD